MQQISTSRLLLRAPLPTDVNSLFLIRANVAINKYINRPLANYEEDVRPWLKKILKSISLGTSYYWVIVFQETRTVIGTICLSNLSINKKVLCMKHCKK
jgi:[ribosomal protein S5]-alanine N-acetyltransferase